MGIMLMMMTMSRRLTALWWLLTFFTTKTETEIHMKNGMKNTEIALKHIHKRKHIFYTSVLFSSIFSMWFTPLKWITWYDMICWFWRDEEWFRVPWNHVSFTFSLQHKSLFISTFTDWFKNMARNWVIISAQNVAILSARSAQLSSLKFLISSFLFSWKITIYNYYLKKFKNQL